MICLLELISKFTKEGVLFIITMLVVKIWFACLGLDLGARP